MLYFIFLRNFTYNDHRFLEIFKLLMALLKFLTFIFSWLITLLPVILGLEDEEALSMRS